MMTRSFKSRLTFSDWIVGSSSVMEILFCRDVIFLRVSPELNNFTKKWRAFFLILSFFVCVGAVCILVNLSTNSQWLIISSRRGAGSHTHNRAYL